MKSKIHVAPASLIRFVLFFFTSFFAIFSYADRVLIVSPEQSEILQTGGLAHATTGLALSLNQQGVSTEILMPYYLEMKAPPLHSTGQVIDVPLDWRGGQPFKHSHFSVYKSDDSKNPTLFLRHENGDGINYFDNNSRGGKKFYGPDFFIGEAMGAWAQATSQYILSGNYDTVILNDWTTGLVAYYLNQAKLQGKKTPKVIFAIHNLAYQGVFPHSLSRFLGIPDENFNIEGVEYHGQLGMLKAGLNYADLIYTVSPRYAEEIRTQRFGVGLDGLMRKKFQEHRLIGVLNGITNAEWDPSIPQKGLPFNFTSDDLQGKDKGKIELQKSLDLKEGLGIPVFVFTSRLSEQKGTAYLIDAIGLMAGRSEAQFVVVGDGDTHSVESMKELEKLFPDKVRYRPFSSLLEKQLMRYGDFFVNASWFEPSGLNQFFALKNGTIPVVSAVGGLLNSIKDQVTGILFPVVEGHEGNGYQVDGTRNNLLIAMERAMKVFKDKSKLQQMRQAGMVEDHSWTSRVNSEVKPMLEYVKSNALTKMDFETFKALRSAAPTDHVGHLTCQRAFAPGI
jgi:starch synthase